MSGREKSRLRKAREDGYLGACCTGNQALVQAYGLWCWRLKIPMVWLERRTRYSRYRRVQLEMYTFRLENQCRNEAQVEIRQEWKTGKILQMA